MRSRLKKTVSLALCIALIIGVVIQGLSAFAGDIVLDITKDGVSVTEKISVKEYESVQLDYTLTAEAPAGSYVVWESNLPLLAGVDDNGKVTGYDYSKAAVIQLWLDEEVRSMPIVGEAMASAIESTFEKSGIDLETANTDAIVAIVSGINKDLGESLRKVLDNMNVEITATLYDENGTALSSDTVEVLVEKSVIASVAPTGVHITNKKVVPKTVAVGATVQLYGACTPVRIKQGIKWQLSDNESEKHATVSDTGLVTFTSAGTVKVKLTTESIAYRMFTDTVTFTVVEASELPVEDFKITGNTTVNEGEATQLSISDLTPAGAYTGNIKWSSSDSNIAVVDQSGVVTGLDGGSGLTYSKTAEISADIDGVVRTATVTVKRSLIGGTEISGVKISGLNALGIGDSSAYTAEVTPSRLSNNKDVVKRWGIKDAVTNDYIYAGEQPAQNAIAKIDSNGTLTGLSSGKVTIFVEAEYSKTTVKDEFEVTIGKAITDFTITGNSSVKEGATTQLSITNILPDDYDPAILDTVVWTVENSKIATVDQNGLVTGLDAGGRASSSKQSTVVTATIGGVSKSFTVEVKGQGLVAINKYTGGEIVGPDCVVVDFPYQYSSIHTPTRINVSRQFWGVVTDEGGAPWQSSTGFGLTSFSGNTENSVVSVDSATGIVSAKEAGETQLWTYMANALSTYQDLTKNIKTVELTPKSITVTAPEKYKYLEGDTELDLKGLKVQITYDKDELALYYPEAANYTEEQMTVEVTDYTVSELNPTLLDNEQFIVVTVNRAGKDMRGIFPVFIESKQVDTIEIIQNPKYEYREGDTALDLTDLKVKANYLNADSEEITGYTVNEGDFDPELLDTVQNITVTYTHAGRSASASFPVIVYGVPVVTVDKGAYAGGWTADTVTLTLDSTHKLEGVTYYYKTDSLDWQQLDGNTLTVSENSDETYYFKAVNSNNIESDPTEGVRVSIDNIIPEIELVPEITEVTNQSYKVTVSTTVIGASGIKEILLDGATDITADGFFTVDENGQHTVKLTTHSGLSAIENITISNIDKEAPEVLSISLEHKENGGFARLINKLSFGLFFNKTVEATVTASDTGVAGVDRIEYRYTDENGTALGDWKIYDDSSRPAQDPDFKGFVEARAIDRAGNISEILRSDGYVIDGTAPTDLELTAVDAKGEYASGSWTSSNVTITLNSTAFSDIYGYYYSLNGGEWVKLEGNELTVDTHGVSEYKFKAVSNADLESAVKDFTVKIDKIQPVIRVDFAGTFGKWTSGGVNFSFSTLDEAISGITYYYDCGEGWTLIETNAELELNNSQNTSYQFKAVNGAGVESNPSDSYRVMIDSVSPSVTFTPAVTDKTTAPYDVAFAVTAGEAGLKSVSVNGVDVTGESSITVSKNGEYVFVLVGENGLVTTKVLTVDNFTSYEVKVDSIKIEKQNGGAPCLFAESFGTVYGEAAVITVTASSNVGAVEKIEYRLLDENGAPASDWQEYSESAKPTASSAFKGFVEARAYGSGAVSAEVRSEGFTVDTVAPEAPAVEALANGAQYDGGWSGGEITVILNSTAFSGIDKYLYRVDGGEWKEIQGAQITLTQNGEHSYEFAAVSKAGLQSAASSLDTRIESTRPVLLIDVDGTIGHRTYDAVTFKLSSPNTLSGIEYYVLENGQWQSVENGVLTVDESCDKALSFKAVSGAGNESYQSPYYKVIIDKNYLTVEQKPILSVDVSGTLGEYTAKGVVFSLSASDCVGSVIYYYDCGEGWQAMAGSVLAVTDPVAKQYKFKAVDSDGRESLESPEYSVMLDTVAPTVSVWLENSDFTNKEVNAVVTAGAGISGVKAITVNGMDITETKKFPVAQNGKYAVTVTAGNGLTTTQVLTVESFDTDAPYITDISAEHKNTGGFARVINAVSFGLFFNEKVEITITAMDNGASGLDRIEYRILNEEMTAVSDWETYNENSKPTLDPEFKGYIEARAVDKAGNASPAVTSKGFVIDSKAPEGIAVSATVNGKEYSGNWVYEDITLTPTATAFSDINSYLYRIDGGEWNVMTSDSIKAIEGLHTYEFKAESNSGVESDIASVITKLEKSAPVLAVEAVGTLGEWTADDVVFVLTTSSNSGVKYYYNNGEGFKELEGNKLVISEAENSEYTFKAVNGAGAESELSESYKVMVDKAVPQINLTPSETEFTNKPVEFKVEITDTGICGIKEVTLNGKIFSADSFTAEENTDYVITAVLNNGKKAVKTVRANNIDTELPSITDISAEHKNTGGFARVINAVSFGLFFNEKVEITITAMDNGASGLDRIEYRILNEEMTAVSDWETYNENSKPTLDPEFKGYIEARAVDKAGNASPAVTSKGFVIDSKAPEGIAVSATVNGKEYSGNWVYEDITLTPTATAFSDINSYLYRIDGGEWNVMTTDSIKAIEGLHTYEFKAVSNSGVESDIASVITKLEKSAPVLAVEAVGTLGEWTANDVVFILTTSSNSGVKYYYNNGEGFKELGGNRLVISEAENSEYTFKAVNGAGAESELSESYKVMVDKAVPQITLTPSETEFTNKPVEFKVEITDTGICGIKEVTLNGEAFSGDAFTAEQNGKYTVEVVLNNGEKAEKTAEPQNIDTEAPADVRISLGAPSGEDNGLLLFGKAVTLNITASDTGVAGIAEIEYREARAEGLLARIGLEGVWHKYDSENPPVIEDGFIGKIQVRATDKAGNVSEVFESAEFAVDETAPKTEILAVSGEKTVKNGAISTEAVTLSFEAEAASGIQKYQYSLNGGEWIDMTDGTVTATEDGFYLYKVRAVSNSGVVGESAEFAFTIDKDYGKAEPTPPQSNQDSQNSQDNQSNQNNQNNQSGQESQGSQSSNQPDTKPSTQPNTQADTKPSKPSPIPNTDLAAASIILPAGIALAALALTKRKKSKK